MQNKIDKTLLLNTYNENVILVEKAKKVIADLRQQYLPLKKEPLSPVLVSFIKFVEDLAIRLPSIKTSIEQASAPDLTFWLQKCKQQNLELNKETPKLSKLLQSPEIKLDEKRKEYNALSLYFFSLEYSEEFLEDASFKEQLTSLKIAAGNLKNILAKLISSDATIENYETGIALLQQFVGVNHQLIAKVQIKHVELNKIYKNYNEKKAYGSNLVKEVKATLNEAMQFGINNKVQQLEAEINKVEGKTYKSIIENNFVKKYEDLNQKLMTDINSLKKMGFELDSLIKNIKESPSYQGYQTQKENNIKLIVKAKQLVAATAEMHAHSKVKNIFFEVNKKIEELEQKNYFANNNRGHYEERLKPAEHMMLNDYHILDDLVKNLEQTATIIQNELKENIRQENAHIVNLLNDFAKNSDEIKKKLKEQEIDDSPITVLEAKFRKVQNTTLSSNSEVMLKELGEKVKALTVIKNTLDTTIIVKEKEIADFIEVTKSIDRLSETFAQRLADIKQKLKANNIDDASSIIKLNDEFNKQLNLPSTSKKLKDYEKRLQKLSLIHINLEKIIIKKENEITTSTKVQVGKIVNNVEVRRTNLIQQCEQGHYAFNPQEKKLFEEFNNLKVVPNNYEEINSSEKMQELLNQAHNNVNELDRLAQELEQIIARHHAAQTISNSKISTNLIEIINKKDKEQVTIFLNTLSCYAHESRILQSFSNNNILRLDELGRDNVKSFIDKAKDPQSLNIRRKLDFISILSHEHVKNNGINVQKYLEDPQSMEAGRILNKYDLNQFITSANLDSELFCDAIVFLNQIGYKPMDEKLVKELNDNHEQCALFQFLAESNNAEELVPLILKLKPETTRSLAILQENEVELCTPWILLAAQDNEYFGANLRAILDKPEQILLAIPFLKIIIKPNMIYLNTLVLTPADQSNLDIFFRSRSRPDNPSVDDYLALVRCFISDPDPKLAQMMTAINDLVKEESIKLYVTEEKKKTLNQFNRQVMPILLSNNTINAKKELIAELAHETFPPTGFLGFVDKIIAILNKILIVAINVYGFFGRLETEQTKQFNKAIEAANKAEPGEAVKLVIQ